MIAAKVFESLPQDAVDIRTAVFMQEQGFKDEFDEIDSKARHIVLYDDEIPAAACRVFYDERIGSYVLGRLAVMKQYRGQSLGSAVVQQAQELVISLGGSSIVLHAQCRVTEFYAKLGYKQFGEQDDDEGCAHIWMKKEL